MKIQRGVQRFRRLGRAAVAALVLGAPAVAGGEAAQGENAAPYELAVDDVAAAVGAQAAVVATLRLHEGYRFLKSYNNRVIGLSSLDSGVSFERKVVRGTIGEGELVFLVKVSPTKPGKHPINGVIRLGYAEGKRSMKMISIPLMATVTGTE